MKRLHTSWLLVAPRGSNCVADPRVDSTRTRGGLFACGSVKASRGRLLKYSVTWIGSGHSPEGRNEEDKLLSPSRPAIGHSVSVIASVKNGDQYAEVFKKNLLATLHPDHELILIDDGSTDNTWPLFLELASLHENTVLIRHESSHGLGKSQEEGVQRASGEYLWLVDCDDEWNPSIVATLLERATRDGSDVVVCRALLRDDATGVSKIVDGVDRDLVVSGDEAVRMMLRGEINGYTWNKLYRRRLFQGEAPPLLTTQPDFCRTALAVAESGRVSTISQVLYTYIRRGNSISDSHEPDLNNLLVSFNYMQNLSSKKLSADANYIALITLFKAWFYAIAVAKTPVLVRASKQTQRFGGKLAQGSLRAGEIPVLARQNRRIAIEAFILKTSPAVYRSLVLSYLNLQRKRQALVSDR